MERLDLFVDLGYGIPMYAVLEVLRRMRDSAVEDPGSGFDYFVSCTNSFRVRDTSALGMCVMANARCVGLSLACLQIKREVAPNKEDLLFVYFTQRKY